jgi:hypothetical protein
MAAIFSRILGAAEVIRTTNCARSNASSETDSAALYSIPPFNDFLIGRISPKTKHQGGKKQNKEGHLLATSFLRVRFFTCEP